MISAVGKYRKTCILLSGGVGMRMNIDIPKQYIEVEGCPIIEYTLRRIISWNAMDSLIIVADKQWYDCLNGIVSRVLCNSSIIFFGYVEPGVNRQYSVINALQYIKTYEADDAVVMVHDAVRPMVSDELLSRCDGVLAGCEGVMPVLQVKDTVYRSADGIHIAGNLDRSTIFAGQTPEFFGYWKYLKANEALSEEDILKVNGSSEPAVTSGMDMRMVRGEESNYKITTIEDLERFVTYIKSL